MWTPEYYVRRADFPASIEGLTVPNDDGSFDIYINQSISEEKQKIKLEHELKHIRRDHFYDQIKNVAQLEAEANGKPPQEMIMCFHSLEHLEHYLESIGVLAREREIEREMKKAAEAKMA